MRKVILAVLIWLLAIVPASAQTEAERLRSAMDQIAAYDWARATQTVRGGSAITRDIVAWHALRGGYGTFQDYRNFLTRRPDWPGLPLLRRAGEDKIPENAQRSEILSYFAGQLPQTGTGSMRLASALQQASAAAVAADELRRAWLFLDLSQNEFDQMLALHGDVLSGQHADRLDRLLWDQKASAAEQMLPLVSADQQKLASARIALLRGEDGVDALIDAIPDSLADSPGLAHARFIWRLKRDRRDAAVSLLLERSERAGGLGNAAAWADKREELARLAMQDQKPDLAYRLASQHGLTSGSDYAALEWLAGFVALRQLDRPEQAVEHFRRFRVAVDTPISLGRAGYWEGRALEAAGRADAAFHAYEFAAEFTTAFYGQLAAARIELPPNETALRGTDIPVLADTPLAESSVLAAAKLLHDAGDASLYRRFLRHLAEAGTPPEQAALGTLALNMGEPYTALYIAKYAADHGNMLIGPYFPTTPDLPANLNVDTALILAVIRRESEFNTTAVSHVGARGLMQVMPGTAQDMAKELGVSMQVEQLTTDETLNIRLGSAYLAHLIEDFDGYLPAVAAAYNAGPSRARNWADLNGYAHGSLERAIDWVEAIPFSETRNYVMRVMEGYQVYRILLGPDENWSLPDLLTGRARLSGSG
jgi:soluble lytic murein transglycosylase